MNTAKQAARVWLAFAFAMALGPAAAGPAADTASEVLAAPFVSPDTRWTSEALSLAPPRYVNNELGRGCELDCDFSLADAGYPRCLWDAKLPQPVDLSKSASIAMNVRLSNPGSARSFCLYLKSNGKWHLSRYNDALGEGPNLVVFQIADYRLEGTSSPCRPESLNHIEEIRVNVFPKEGLRTAPTVATMTGVRVVRRKIDELKGARSPEVEARFLRWQEEAVSDVVRRICEGVRAARPKAVILVDGHPLVKPKLSDQGRNEWLWLERRWIDAAYNMDYGWRPNFRAYEEAANATDCPERFVLMLGNYDSEGGKSFPRRPEQLARLVDYALKKYPNRGIALFDYTYLTDQQVKALRAGPFAEEAVPCWPQH